MIEPPPGWIDPACPVNWRHPLSRGLVGFWAAPPIPGWSGGLTLRDLVRGKRKPNDFTLTNGPAWVGGILPAHRSVSFDGTNDQADTGSVAAYNGAELTVAVVFQDRGGNTGGGAGSQPRLNDHVIGLGGYNVGGGWSLVFISSTQVHWNVATGATAGAFGYVGDARTTSGWNHACLTSSTTGPSNKAYFDGIQSGSTQTTTTRATSTQFIRLAQRPSDGENVQSAIRVASVTVWNRVLSDSEVAAHYSQSRRGFPDVLGWIDNVPVVASEAAAPGGTVIPVIMNHRRMMGAA